MDTVKDSGGQLPVDSDFERDVQRAVQEFLEERRAVGLPLDETCRSKTPRFDFWSTNCYEVSLQSSVESKTQKDTVCIKSLH